MNFFVHPQGICESTDVGEGTRIWAFAHVLGGAVIGKDCNICDSVFIENDVVMGDHVTVKCGVQLWNGLRVEDDVFIGPNATFTNDRFPRSKQYPDKFLTTTIEKKASIGANATIIPGVTIGRGAMVGAGSVVTRSVPPNAIVYGNPARIKGYATALRKSADRQSGPEASVSAGKSVQPTTVHKATMHRFRLVEDMRGNLVAAEFEKDLPFQPKRCFMVFDVPSEEIRGEHAHRKCAQFLICIKGSCHAVLDDGANVEEFELNSPAQGLYLPPMVWGVQYQYSRDAVLLVFASEPYESGDYIRNYEEFLLELKSRPAEKV